MTDSNWKKSASFLGFEIFPSLRGSFFWLALASLVLLIIPVRIIFTGEFSINGQAVGTDPRLNYVIVIGYSILVFLTTLFALALCLERTGNQYLNNHDLLILSRNVGRTSFYLTKLASVILPTVLYAFIALSLFWEELYRLAGVNLFLIFVLIFPLTLAMTCLTSLFFLLRNYLSSYMIFFICLIGLPIIYGTNLWHYYAGALRGSEPHFSFLEILPQFGGVHAYSLGLIGDQFFRGDTWHALVNIFVWTVVSLLLGLKIFSKKRF